MATTSITFTQDTTTGRYQAIVTASSSQAALHLEFSHWKGNKITILRSVDGTTYSTGASIPFAEQVFDKTLVGLVSGLKLKILCDNEPSNAKILQ